MSRRHGFTLLEILIAVTLGLMLLLIAVPSISGMIREQALRKTFQSFDDFVRAAQVRAVEERRTYVMVWGETGIDLVPLNPTMPDSLASSGIAGTNRGAYGNSGDEDAEEPPIEPAAHFAFEEDAVWSLRRPAALVKKPVLEWPFWRSGVCEPAVVDYEAGAGKWSAEYSGLTMRGRVTAMEVK